MNLLLSAGAISLLACIVGFGPNQEKKLGHWETTLDGNPAKGRRVFVKKNCVDCHAVLGSGGKIGPDLTKGRRGRSYFEVLARLWDHSPKMLSSMKEENIKWPMIDKEDMGHLVSYLYYLNYFDEPGSYKRGKQAFSAKSCIRCHSIGGEGGDDGVPLDRYGKSASPISMVTAMWNHGPAMMKQQGIKKIKTARFSGTDAADILAFLRASTTEQGGQSRYLAPGDPVSGRKVFAAKRCDLCHTLDGKAEKGKIDLYNADMQKSVSDLAGVLWNHGQTIWDRFVEEKVAIKPFAPEQMSDLVAFLYSLRYFDPSGDIKNGEELFKSRGCVNCHNETVREEVRGPILHKMKSTGDPIAFASAFWNHAPEMLKVADSESLPWPRLKQTEMRDIFYFLFSKKTK